MKFVYSLMPLQSEKNKKDILETNYFLPGKPLTPKQLTQLIESSRKSGMISMEAAHRKIRNSFNSI